MANRKINFTNGEYYHICNRGVDHRSIVADHDDSDRFVQGLTLFNSIEPIGSIYEKTRPKKSGGKIPENISSLLDPLVNIAAYCLNPNHYHFILRQVYDNGVSEFMRRVNGGYTSYFNGKYERTGSLFAGTFKAKHIGTNEYLLHVSAYVNLNNRVHEINGQDSTLIRSSWGMYTENKSDHAGPTIVGDIILGQFNTRSEYKTFALTALSSMIERKHDLHELDGLLIE